jgi:hypothetical protein
MNEKLCVLIITSTKAPWSQWSKAQKHIFSSLGLQPGVEIFWIYGSDDRRSWNFELKLAANLHKILVQTSKIPGMPKFQSQSKFLKWLFWRMTKNNFGSVTESGEKLLWSGPDDYAFLAQKTLACLNYIAESRPEVTYFLRTNNSSIWDFELLMLQLEKLVSDDIFMGIRSTFGTIEFVSGAGILMSRNLAAELVSEKRSLSYQLVDDVCFGKFMGRPASGSSNFMERVDPPFSEDIPPEALHFRCKPGDTIKNMAIAFEEISSRR